MPGREKNVGLYTGPRDKYKFGRDLYDIQELFAEGQRHPEIIVNNPPKIDHLLSEIAQSAEFEGNVNIVDVGSGSGQFLQSLITPMANEFLSYVRARHLTINAIGLTDANTLNTFGQADPKLDKKIQIIKDESLNLESFNQIDDRHSIQNFFYTLTAAQTLEQFLVDRQVNDINFALASQSLIYLSARVMEQTLDTLISKLSPGGKVVVSGVGRPFRSPLPAFVGVEPEKIIGEENSLYVKTINLFTKKESVASETQQPETIPQVWTAPLLALRADWPQLKQTAQQIIFSAKNRYKFDLARYEPHTDLGFKSYLEIKNSPSNSFYKSKFPQLIHLPKVNDQQAKNAIYYSLILIDIMREIKRRQGAKQSAQKQTYLEQLQARDDITFTVIQRILAGLDENGKDVRHIHSFVIERPGKTS